MMSVHLNIGRQPDTMIDPIELMPNEDDVVESFEDQLD